MEIARYNRHLMKPLMNAAQIDEAINNITDHILAALQSESVDVSKLALVGIRRRGEILASRLSDRLAPQLKFKPPVGALDITLYRDDAMRAPLTVPLGTEMDFRLDDRPVILVDDVLFTGRSVRAALDAMVDFGRPQFIRLAVLFDRVGREYPIAADFVGEQVHVDRHSVIVVELRPMDALDRVVIQSKAKNERLSS